MPVQQLFIIGTIVTGAITAFVLLCMAWCSVTVSLLYKAKHPPIVGGISAFLFICVVVFGTLFAIALTQGGLA